MVHAPAHQGSLWVQVQGVGGIVEADTIHRKVHEHVKTGSAIYTDEHAVYVGPEGLFYSHDSVNQGAKEYVRDNVHTNSIESL